MTGDSAAARSEAARLQSLRGAAADMRIAYWAQQLAIQAEVVRGLATCAEGNAAECLAILRAAADREDATEKHAVTPAPILPAREVVATVLLRQGNSQGALREFEAVLAKEPNRYRALAGALQAAERAGDTTKAKRLAAQILDQTAAADSPWPEIDAARRLASRKPAHPIRRSPDGPCQHLPQFPAHDRGGVQFLPGGVPDRVPGTDCPIQGHADSP